MSCLGFPTLPALARRPDDGGLADLLDEIGVKDQGAKEHVADVAAIAGLDKVDFSSMEVSFDDANKIEKS